MTTANKIGGKEFNSTSFEIKPPNQIVYSMSPREVETETPDKQYTIKGKISFKMTVTLKFDPGQQRRVLPAPSSIPAHNRDWVPVVIVVGTILVIAAIVIFPPSAGALPFLEAGGALGLGARAIVR